MLHLTEALGSGKIRYNTAEKDQLVFCALRIKLTNGTAAGGKALACCSHIRCHLDYGRFVETILAKRVDAFFLSKKEAATCFARARYGVHIVSCHRKEVDHIVLFRL